MLVADVSRDPHHPVHSARPKSNGFVWPPRPAPDHIPPPPEVAAAAPSPHPKQSIRPIPLQQPAAPGGQLARAWADIERTWLDVTAPTLIQRMAEEYWSPDAPTDYCFRCGLSVGRHEAVEGLCPACASGETKNPPWQRLIRLGEYEPPLSRWICEVKFTRWRALGYELGRVLGESIKPQIHAARAAGEIPDGPPVIVPVPMSFLRRLVRGIDHTTVIARGVADAVGGRVVQPLTRAHRPSQTQVAPSGRTANVAGTIRPRSIRLRPRLGGGLVIALDDVTTTTSTLRGACRAVAECLRTERDREKAGNRGKTPPIWGAVLARTPPDRSDGGQDGYS